jgi:hypothetical protein
MFIPFQLQLEQPVDIIRRDASLVDMYSSGERGIRTPGPRERTTVFKTAAFDHSAISPLAQK